MRKEWAEGRIFAQSGTDIGMLENEGSFLLLGDNAWFNGSILNRGEILKPGPARDPSRFYSSAGADLVNDGLIRVESGGLRWGGTVLHRGVWEAAAGASIQLSAATRSAPGSLLKSRPRR